MSAAWTPRYVALSAFKREALGAIDYTEQAASEHCLRNSKHFKSRFASALCFPPSWALPDLAGLRAGTFQKSSVWNFSCGHKYIKVFFWFCFLS